MIQRELRGVSTLTCMGASKELHKCLNLLKKDTQKHFMTFICLDLVPKTIAVIDC